METAASGEKEARTQPRPHGARSANRGEEDSRKADELYAQGVTSGTLKSYAGHVAQIQRWLKERGQHELTPNRFMSYVWEKRRKHREMYER